MSDPYNPVTLSRYYYARRISSRRVSITSNPTRTRRTLSRRLRTKSPRSNEDDTEEKTLALYPKVQIRAFVPRISSLTREGRWSRNQVWPGPSSGHCQVFVAPPFRPWRRKMLFRPPAVRSSSRDRPRRTKAARAEWLFPILTRKYMSGQAGAAGLGTAPAYFAH